MRKLMFGAMVLALSSISFADTPPPAPPAAEAPAAPTEKMICKSKSEIGSLVRKTKTCHTKAQWAYIEANNRDDLRRMEEDNRSRTSGQ